MKPILLDTHAYLWYAFDDPRLSEKAVSSIESDDHPIHLSVASLWEMAIKIQVGKLSLGRDLDRFVDEFVTSRTIDVLPVELSAILRYSELPLHHRDPFDRMLVAQAMVHDLPIVTGDPNIGLYGTEIIW